MLGWIKRFYRKRAQSRARPGEPAAAKVQRPTAKSKRSEKGSSEQPPFDWTALSTFPAEDRHIPEPAPFDELASWADAVQTRCEESWDTLSAFPPIATKIFSLLEHPDFNLQDLVNLIHQDPTISADVLRAANSVFYARSSNPLDIRDAVQRLGAREVAGIAAAASTRTLFDMETRVADEQFVSQARALWHHSMTCAFTAGWLAMDRGRGSLDHSFLGGMLHDVGKTLALRALAALVVSGKIPSPIPDDRVERVLEEVHLSIGAEAMKRWSLPPFFIGLCDSHHGLRGTELLPDRDFHIVRLVSGMNEIRVNPRYLPGLIPDVQESADALGLTPQLILYVASQLKEYADRADQLYTA